MLSFAGLSDATHARGDIGQNLGEYVDRLCRDKGMCRTWARSGLVRIWPHCGACSSSPTFRYACVQGFELDIAVIFEA